MAFTGTPIVVQISDRLVRITGLSLASAASGTIGLFGATGTAPGVRLPASFKATTYVYGGEPVALVDSVSLAAEPAAVGVATAIPIAVVKAGATEEEFRITITNTHGSLATPNMEFYVGFHE